MIELHDLMWEGGARPWQPYWSVCLDGYNAMEALVSQKVGFGDTCEAAIE